MKNPAIPAEQKLKPVVVIDEVQKLPEILDKVHRLIETRKLTFLLTYQSIAADCGASANSIKNYIKRREKYRKFCRDQL